MPLGTPGAPGQSVWQIKVRSIEQVAGYTLTFETTISVDNPDNPQVPGIIQKYIDHLDSSPDFIFTSAGRTYTIAQPMTLTPPGA